MNFLDLYKKIKSLDEGLSQGNMMPQAISAPPSEPAVEECGAMEECCDMDHPESKQSDSVSMNVTMNGQGAGGIRDLMNILRNIDDAIPNKDHEPHHEPHGSDELIIGEPNVLHDIEPVQFEEPPSLEIETDEDNEYENEPDPQEFDNIISGNDLNKKKDGFPMAQKGDNAMAAFKKTAAVMAVSESLVNRLSKHYGEVKTRKY